MSPIPVTVGFGVLPRLRAWIRFENRRGQKDFSYLQRPDRSWDPISSYLMYNGIRLQG
jgi:hypothetical protein